MSDDRFAARARAVKAFKLARVCEAMLDVNPDLDADAFRSASPDFRARVAEVAGTRVPSEETWAIVVAMTEHTIDRREAEKETAR